MHIPDGYLGPATCAAGYAAMAPLWAVAARKVKNNLQVRQVPLLAFGAAFSFLIMMFNVPIPGGTTGHAVGGVLAAILLGPWAAMIAVSIALAIQALLFGDGGITAFGANCFNMAVVLPFAGYYIYKILAGGSPPDSRRRILAAGVAGYVGLCLAGAMAGMEFGLQPLLHHTPEGQALYCPYGLNVALPIMIGEHALVFGWVEAIATAMVLKYLQMLSPAIQVRESAPMKTVNKLWISLGVLILLSPLGLILPEFFKSGPAWGEWGTDEIKKFVGYIPRGLQKLSETWKAPFPDYAFKGWENKGLGFQSMVTIVAGLLGAALVALGAWIAGRMIAKKEKPGSWLKNGFVEKTLWGLLRLMKESLFAEETANEKGLLQSLDPRVRALSLMGLLVCVLFAKSFTLLAALYLAAVLLALASRISLPSFLARTWVFIPLFSLFIALPALTVWVSPGEVVCRIGPVPITRQGIGAAAFFVLRVAGSVSFALLITLTTRHFELLRALRAFGIPQVFVLILGMTCRYIHLFIGLLENVHRAILSRVGLALPTRKGQRLAAWNIANLWLRSHRLSEEVYHAMLSRGFKGEPVLLMEFKTRLRDWVFLAALCLAVFMIFWMN